MAKKDGVGVGCLLCACELARLSTERAALAGSLLVTAMGSAAMGDTIECPTHGERALRAMLVLGEILTEAGENAAAVTVAGGLREATTDAPPEGWDAYEPNTYGGS